MTDNSMPKLNSASVGTWLSLLATMLFAIVVVGGATRLTGSGLSITEWQPLLGIIPPMNEGDWQAKFAKYQATAQFKIQNNTMTIAAFHNIYWWEWSHRVLARSIGAVAILPFIYFAARRLLPQGQWPYYILLLALGGVQGLLGWYMVKSGLDARISVSQYWLAAHLICASTIFALALWLRFSINAKHKWFGSGPELLAVLLLFLVFMQLCAGAFVAGLGAGQGYNTWPLIDGALVPQGLGAIDPWWKNIFENALTVQFEHRTLAYIIFALTFLNLVIAFGVSSFLLFYIVLMQAALGIFTLLLHVPLSLGLVHQAGAMIVLLAAVWNLHRRTIVE